VAKSTLRLVRPTTEKRTVTPRRRPNAELRTREHLTEREVERLIEAAKANRHAHAKTSADRSGFSKRTRRRLSYRLRFSPPTRVSKLAPDCKASTRSCAFSMPAAAASW
jgi:hypothetical protein